MKPAEVPASMISARVALDQICKLLESPTPPILDRCALVMEQIISELEAAKTGIAQAGGGTAAEARHLRRTVHRARALLELAERYHFRWRAILAGMSGGYTGAGAPVSISPRVRVSIQG
jgi:hypothetical protein